MSSQESGERKTRGPRLVVWAPCLSPSTSRLPVLDPDSLYAATLTQARGESTSYSISAPSALFNTQVPCLEDTSTGLCLADDLDSIASYLSEHFTAQDDAIMIAEDSSNEDTSKLNWARRKALERYLLSILHPLVYQELFSRSLFYAHTSKIYQAGLPLLYRGSLINRLRKELRVNLARRAQSMQSGIEEELGAILSESNTGTYLQQEEEREREILAERSGIHKDGKRGKGLAAFRGAGMLVEEKEKAARAFSEMRMKKYAKKVFDHITEALGEDQYLYKSEKPSLLDVRLFSLLAPLLLPLEHYPTLAKSTLPTLIRSEYPKLVSYTERIQKLLWPIEVQSMLQSSLSSQGGIDKKQMCLTPGWPIIIGREDEVDEPQKRLPLAIHLASSLGTICGQAYRLSSTLFTSLSSTTKAKGKGKEKETVGKASANAAKNEKPVMTPAEKQDARRVAIGRWIWISSAVVGIIATAFASGLLAIEFVDPNHDIPDDAETVEMDEYRRDDAQTQASAAQDAEDSNGVEDAESDKVTEINDDEDFELVEIDSELDEDEEVSGERAEQD